MMRIVFTGIFIVLLISACSNERESTKPTINTLSESVYASIKVVPQDMYKVYTTSPGILQDVLIAEGDLVTAGQKIARVKALNSKTRIDNASLDLDLAEANYRGESNNLKTITDEITGTRKQLALDSLSYFRKKRLWSKDIGSKADLDNTKLKYELSINQLDRLLKKYDQTQIQLDLQFQKSKNNLNKVKSDLGDYIVRSRITGRIYQLFKDPGEFISIQEPLAQIGKSDDFIIEMVIDEVDIAKIQVGQTAYLSLEAYEDEIYAAEIRKILPLKDDRTQTYTVEAIFLDTPNVLYAGLSGEANILLSKPRDVITIPIGYLIDNSKVQTPDGEVSIRIGTRNITDVEVISGIDTSTIIIKPEIR